MQVAIDGPSGSGKSSVAKAISHQYNWGYIDTGAMYRACTWFIIDLGVNCDEAEAVAEAMETLVLEVKTDPLNPGIFVNGTDVSSEIREDQVTGSVSSVSAVPEVRRRMVELQRRLASELDGSHGGVVMEGRDIGTAVLTDAPLKIFLTADSEARALRRAEEDELAGRTTAIDIAETRAKLLARDNADSTRKSSPLVKAVDAVEVDATYLNLEQVVEVVDMLVTSQLNESNVRETP